MRACVEFPIKTHDGLVLLGRRWPPASMPCLGRALLLHGVGEHSGRYSEVASIMTRLGLEVVSYDQRGFGRSDGNRGAIPTRLTLVTDAAMVFNLVRREGPREPPPFLVAHSMGGTIAAYAVTKGLIVPRGLALSSPAIEPRVTELEEQALRALLPLAPNVPLDSGIRRQHVTRDLDEQKKIKADKRMHTTITPRLTVSLIDQGRWAFAEARRINVPVLLLVAGADLVVDQDMTVRFFARISGNLSTLHLYKGLFHEVFKELPVDRKEVFTHFERWLRRQLGLPAVRVGKASRVRPERERVRRPRLRSQSR